MATTGLFETFEKRHQGRIVCFKIFHLKLQKSYEKILNHLEFRAKKTDSWKNVLQNISTEFRHIIKLVLHGL